MKNFLKMSLLIIMIMVIAACSPTGQVSNASYDDVYFTSSPKKSESKQAQPSSTRPSDYTRAEPKSNQEKAETSRFDYSDEPPASSTSTTTDQEGNTYITNNYYYDPDDYYDYAYTARLRRFYRPYGWGYFDSYYTNMYWYDYNPASWGVSIYMGYNWWAPAWYYSSPFTWGISISYGWPHYHCWGYPYWYWNHPYYYPYYYPSYSYWHGYNQGYWHGYWHGYYNGLYSPYYYNTYDYNSYQEIYYGPRRSGSRSGGSSAVPRTSLAQLYQKSGLSDRPLTPVISTVAAPEQNAPPRPAIKSNTTVKPVQNNAVESSPPRPVNTIKDKDAVPVKKDKPSRAEEYTPAPSIKNPPASDPRPGNNQMETAPSRPVVRPDKRDDNYSPAPRPQQNYQMESAPPRQDNINESKPRPTPHYQLESEPVKPRPEHQAAPRPFYQQPTRDDRPKIYDSRPASQPDSRPHENQSVRQQKDNSSERKRK